MIECNAENNTHSYANVDVDAHVGDVDVLIDDAVMLSSSCAIQISIHSWSRTSSSQR